MQNVIKHLHILLHIWNRIETNVPSWYVMCMQWQQQRLADPAIFCVGSFLRYDRRCRDLACVLSGQYMISRSRHCSKTMVPVCPFTTIICTFNAIARLFAAGMLKINVKCSGFVFQARKTNWWLVWQLLYSDPSFKWHTLERTPL